MNLLLYRRSISLVSEPPQPLRSASQAQRGSSGAFHREPGVWLLAAAAGSRWSPPRVVCSAGPLARSAERASRRAPSELGVTSRATIIGQPELAPLSPRKFPPPAPPVRGVGAGGWPSVATASMRWRFGEVVELLGRNSRKRPAWRASELWRGSRGSGAGCPDGAAARPTVWLAELGPPQRDEFFHDGARSPAAGRPLTAICGLRRRSQHDNLDLAVEQRSEFLGNHRARERAPHATWSGSLLDPRRLRGRRDVMQARDRTRESCASAAGFSMAVCEHPRPGWRARSRRRLRCVARSDGDRLTQVVVINLAVERRRASAASDSQRVRVSLEALRRNVSLA